MSSYHQNRGDVNQVLQHKDAAQSHDGGLATFFGCFAQDGLGNRGHPLIHLGMVAVDQKVQTEE